MKIKLLRSLVWLALAASSASFAADYPTKTITMIVPFAAGGPTGPAMNDLLGGQVDLMCDQVTNTMSQIKTGKVKAYAVTYKNPVSTLPDIPPLANAGLPGFALSVWHGLYAPKGASKEVVSRLSGALQYALKDTTVKQRLADLSTDPVAENRATPEALRAHLKAEIDKWGSIITKAGVYAE